MPVSYTHLDVYKRQVQGIPENRNAWASGDGHGKGNMEGIHIEICYSKSGVLPEMLILDH